jgi:hypothetical protein
VISENFKVHTVVLNSGDSFQTEVKPSGLLSNKPNNGSRIGFAAHGSQRSSRLVDTSRQIRSGVNRQCIGYVDRAKIIDTISASKIRVVAPVPTSDVGAAYSRHMKND